MRKAPAEEEWQELPTIIVDPSLLTAERVPLRLRLRTALATMAQGFAAAFVIVVTVAGVSLSDLYLRVELPESGASRPRMGRDIATARPAAQATFGAAILVPDLLPPPPPKRTSAGAVAHASAPPEPSASSASAAPAAPGPEASSLSQPVVIVGQEQGALHARLREGRRSLASGQLERAEQRFRAVLNERANHPGALAGLARIAILRGDAVAAVALARRAVHAAPAHAFYHSVLGDALRESGEPAGADLEYETAARLSEAERDRARVLPPNPYLGGS